MCRKDVNNYVLTVDDLGEALGGFFRRPMGRACGRALLKLMRVDTLNKVHAECASLDKEQVAAAILQNKRVQVSYTLHGENYLDSLPKEGGFFTVSNHPYGGLDGVMLIDIMQRVRPDFMVLVNDFLSRVTVLEDYWIPVVPKSSRRRHDPSRNVNGLRRVANHIQEGHPVGLFPAAGLPHYDKELRRPVEIPWKMSAIRMMALAGIPIVPIMFEGDNSRRYYRFGRRYGYSAASILIPSEMVNKRHQNIDVYVGSPILPQDLEQFGGNMEKIRQYIMTESLGILPSYKPILNQLSL